MSDANIELVRSRINIVELVEKYVALKRNGSRFSGPCPFHGETRASFFVDPDKGFFHCFGCQASGDIFDFYSRIHGVNFAESLVALAEMAGVTLQKRGFGNSQLPSKRREMFKILEVVAGFFHECLLDKQGQIARDYLANRGINREIIDKFQLGFAPDNTKSLVAKLKRNNLNEDLALELGILAKSRLDNIYSRFYSRLMFPIKEPSGRVIAFGGRILDSNPDIAKYINSSDSQVYKKGEHLFGFPEARQAITKLGVAFLTEGYLDVLSLQQFGYANALGVLGTALTQEQVKRLSHITKKVVLLFDGDAAGQKATMRAITMFMSQGLDCQVCQLPAEDDVDSILQKQGTEALNSYLAKTIDGLQFALAIVRKQSLSERVEWARGFLEKITLPEVVNLFVGKLALGLDLSEMELRNFAAKQRQLGHDNQKVKLTAKVGTLRLNIHEKQILHYAVRYPNRLSELVALDVEVFLEAEEARNFWEKLSVGIELSQLNRAEKKFWEEACGINAAPLDDGEKELADLKQDLQDWQRQNQISAMQTALFQNSQQSPDTEVIYLQALQNSLLLDNPENTYE